MKVFLGIFAFLLLASALMMPWCVGYLEEAGRVEMAHSATMYGLSAGSLGVLISSILFANS